MEPLKVECYTMKKKGQHFAGCITLNLFAFGETQEKAQINLDTEIKEYLSLFNDLSFNAKNFKEVEHLLNRPAPIYMWVEYSLCYIISHVETFIFHANPKNWLSFKGKYSLLQTN